LVRFGYDGAPFAGWARQPGLRSVEGEIRRGLGRVGIDVAASGLEVASRTDRGVSARANALALRAPTTGTELLRRLNGIDPDLVFTAAAPIPEEFRVRRATRRVYRYYDGGPCPDAASRDAAARLFVGTVDVRSFGRSIASDAPAWRTVESVVVVPEGEASRIEVRAPSFVWGMVRKIVGALREVDAGRLTLPRLRAALAGTARLTLPMAEPEPLVLWEVEYDRPWTVRWPGPTRAQRAAARTHRHATWARARVLEALAEGSGRDADPR
jgi:tRNA pseudouridine38-40 synthase